MPQPVRSRVLVMAFVSLVVAVAVGLVGCRPDPAPDSAPSPPAVASPSSAEPSPPAQAIRYRLQFEDAPRHLVDVEMRWPMAWGGELFLPAWTPGSYRIRDYARHIEEVEASIVSGDGVERRLEVVKTAKDRWRVEVPESGQPAAELVARYRVYARERTVRTNWVDADLAMLNGAPTFLSPVAKDDATRDVELVLPEGWADTATALEPHPSGRASWFRASDLDTLIDSPIVAGNPLRLSFEVEAASTDGPSSIRHEVVHIGDIEGLDLEWSRDALARLATEHVAFWQHVPYPRYLFLNVVTPGGGGLEHLDSTLMLVNRWRLSDPEAGRSRWLGLVSHELFHAWNGKRLRPAVLGPFDYTRENYTTSLGVVEGFTSYYGPLLLRRSELWDDDELLAALSRAIQTVEASPGRRVRSLAESSFDAWIKQYQPDENFQNTAVDYYSKGAVAGWLVDAAIRREHAGRRSLDDVLRGLYDRYSGAEGYPPSAVRSALVEVGGEGVAELWDQALLSTDDIDYGPVLDYFGLRWTESEVDPDVGWLGFIANPGTAGNALVIDRVPRNTPAFAYGLQVGDEILAIDQHRVGREDWDARRALISPGTEASLLIDRDGRLRRLSVVFDQEPAATWTLEVDPNAGRGALSARRAWLE